MRGGGHVENRNLQYALLSVAMLLVRAGTSEAQLPAGTRGFSGQVQGTVVSKGMKSSFHCRVDRIIHTRKDSKATKPEALAGQTVAVWPRWEKKDGYLRQAPLHVTFVRRLKSGERITLNIRNSEMSHFEILELSAEQRQNAARVQEEGEDGSKGGTEGRVTSARVERIGGDIDLLQEKIRKLREELDRRKKKN